jgi:hypothetical protein
MNVKHKAKVILARKQISGMTASFDISLNLEVFEGDYGHKVIPNNNKNT